MKRVYWISRGRRTIPVFTECKTFEHEKCPGENTFVHQQACECPCHYRRITKRKATAPTASV